MSNFNKNLLIKKKILFSLVCIVLLSCQSVEKDIIPETEPFYMARPRILLDSSSTSLPLTLNWEEVKGVRCYEIQLSESSDFKSSSQNWTMRQSSFSLNSLTYPVFYIRIRSQFDGGFSRWSEILKISRQENEIHLQWLR